jgi:GMP synthase-like glutamine amidotransferase
VGRNPSGRFVLQMEQVRMTPAALRHPDLLACLSAAAGPPAAAGTAAAGPAAAGMPRRQPQLLPSLRLLESHGDQVLALPPGAVTLATSGTAAHELWAAGPNVLAFQFHIEIDGRLAHEKIWPAIKAAGRWAGGGVRGAGAAALKEGQAMCISAWADSSRGPGLACRFTEEEAQQSERSLLCCQPDDESMLQLVKHFIAHGLGPEQQQEQEQGQEQQQEQQRGQQQGEQQPADEAAEAETAAALLAVVIIGSSSSSSDGSGGPKDSGRPGAQPQQHQDSSHPHEQQQQQHPDPASELPGTSASASRLPPLAASLRPLQTSGRPGAEMLGGAAPVPDAPGSVYSGVSSPGRMSEPACGLGQPAPGQP